MKPDEIRIASVYFFQGRALVHALGRTLQGAWIPVGTVQVLPAEPLPEVAAALLAALAASRRGLPQPADWASVMEPLLEASGARKWPDFLKEAVCLGVEQRNGDLSVVPTRNLGEEGGFEPLPTEAVRPDRTEATPLAQALLAARERCR
ncbi:MAG TPA: hypothetical protein VJ570_12705 [Holophagaceae bacterium]|nr:hypothetical protein [Holophagaceae bacterium]